MPGLRWMSTRTRRIGRVPRKRVRVSVSCPFTGSSTVRRSTPFCSPMLTKVVGDVLLIPASSMSAMQMAEGGAVRACRLIVSSVLSGSSEMMRTVWSSQPTACAPNK